MADQKTNNVRELVAVKVEDQKNKDKNKDKDKDKESSSCAAAMADRKLLQINNVEKLVANLTILLSLPIAGFIFWLFYVKETECESILKLPSFQLGISIGLIFLILISDAVVLLRSRFPVLGFLVIMLPLILIFIIGLALVGAFKMESRSVAASPKWFRLNVYDDTHWDDIKSCIFDTGACDDLVARTLMVKSYDFSLKKLSSIESGCCKPATICEMEYVNATFWRRKEEERTVNKTNPYDSDCDLWDNDKGSLCYNCLSCKRGFLETLQGRWWRLGVYLILTAVFLVTFHLMLFVATMYRQCQS